MKKIALIIILLGFGTRLNAQTRKTVLTGDTTIYKAVETSPEPQGGESAFEAYFQKHFKYPEPLLQDDIGVHTVMKWVVEKDGSLSNFEVVRGASPKLAAILIKIFRSYPKWIPGKHYGKVVRAEYFFSANLELGMGKM